MSARTQGPACPRCGAQLFLGDLAPGPQRCPACLLDFEAMPLAPPAPRLVVSAMAEAGPGGAVPCAQHAGNVAVASCSRCGVFICALCRVQVDGRELCPACFDRLSAEGALPSVRGRLRNWRGFALLSGFGGCWLYFLGLLTGPLTIYLAIQAQRQRRQLEESDGLGGVILAFVLGFLQIAISLWLIGALLTGIARQARGGG
jgi:hypothetical protein